MEWENLFSYFRNYIFSINKTKILTLLSSEVFNNYPDNLPNKLTNPMFEDMEELQTVIELIANKKSKEVSERNFKSETTKYLLDTIIAEMSIQNKQINPEKFQDYDRILLLQELVMYIAHLEAFINDTIRILCNLKPKIMTLPKGDKIEQGRSVDWNDILNYDNWEDLVQDLIERYVYSFGYKSFKERNTILKEKFQLKLNISQEKIDKYIEAEEIRHCLIHNGGKATQKFLEKTKRKDVKIGDFIPLSSSFNKEIYSITKEIANIIFTQASSNFFKNEYSNAKKNPVMSHLFEID